MQKLGLKLKLVTLFLSIGLIPCLLIGAQNYWMFYKTLIKTENKFIKNYTDARVVTIENYFEQFQESSNDFNSQSKNRIIINSLSEGFNNVVDKKELTKEFYLKEKNKFQMQLEKEYLPKFTAGQIQINSKKLMNSLGPNGIYLRNLIKNDIDEGNIKRDQFKSFYDELNEEINRIYDIPKDGDVLVVDAKNNRILFSTRKNIDLFMPAGGHLLKNSGIHNLLESINGNIKKGNKFAAGFSNYPGAFGELKMFLGFPLVSEGKHYATIVVEIGLNSIAKLIEDKSDDANETSGFIIGKDGYLRTDFGAFKASEHLQMKGKYKQFSKTFLDLMNAKTGFIKGPNLVGVPSLTFYSIINYGPINWVLVAGKTMDVVLSPLNETLLQVVIFLTIILAIVIFVGVTQGASLIKPMKKILEKLRESSQEVKIISDEIELSSQKLSETTSEQSATIQSTVINMDEISAMLQQTELNVNQTFDLTKSGRKQSEEASNVIKHMLNAMDEIQNSNIKLKSIENLMNEIKGKTLVINEIVSETRLLSFNASIEAARAGTHGKGFAVVAEEIGKLASMSGQAAEEISELLESSSAQVKAVVSSNLSKVEEGRKASSDCEKVFITMSDSLLQITRAIEKINMASMEQSTGVKQTSKAMNEMESITQQNATNASDLTKKADVLHQETSIFNQAIKDLENMLHGQTNITLNKKIKTKFKKTDFEKKDNLKEEGPIVKDSNSKQSTVERSDSRWKNG